ncbi:R3H domain-containingprotein [Purpureocillium lavendulum]|uniref:R3H domain-containingprotein n=1 Tax=Purpureocillium lavendulum TaxID=1247861 RepID=A0AB34FNR9_9HYPO|nr:R3H domain-containingprotein [Purpureocillium lavendulum]
MASAQISSELPRPSFAKVAASIAEEAPSRPVQTNDHTPNDKLQDTGMPKPVVVSSAPGVVPRSSHSASAQPPPRGKLTDVDSASVSLQNLKIGTKVPSLVVDGSSSAPDRQRGLISRESGSDESQKCDSSSELGTKPPSLDGKSITSGTTFAMDEKESLRPDDSASVKAAAEDDDAFSIRGSFIAGSRMSSDIAARARGIQLGDIPERRLVHPPSGPLGHGILTPQSSSSEQPPVLNAAMPLSAEGSSDALNVIYRQAPDEKLLDALASPRDRYFLLRLEKDVIDFVQDSKMLTHKLADYYHMTHSFEPHIGSVRIFRTPFCRVPPSLATMAPQPSASASSTPPPAVLPKKIMRRGHDNDGALVSAGASKPASESGSDGKDGKDKQPVAKEKMSREEREEMYKLARERIFGSSENSVQENDGESGMSRTSSVSATNKANGAKRGKVGKQRRDDSDSFDSRNLYTPYWGPQQQTWVPQPQGQFIAPAQGQFAAQPHPTFPGQAAPVYTQQPSNYPAMANMGQAPGYPTYGMSQQYPPPPPPQQRYQPTGSPMTAYGSPVPPAAVPQTWQPGFVPQTYQARGPLPPPSQSQLSIPYAYGQLPANANPHDPKSQHPIPGSYNRNHAFNPKTQSFVPGGSPMHPIPPPQPPFTAPGSHHGSPQIGTPHLAYAPYPPAVPPSYGGGYGMARQGSNNSIPSYHGPPMPQHAPPPMQSMPPPQHVVQNATVHVANRSGVPGAPNQIYSHLPTYGNPATLPQKPAAGI